MIPVITGRHVGCNLGRMDLVADGRYELVERIGSGGMGEVFRAREIGLDFPREVCVKRLAGGVAPGERRTLREEARLLARVRHANVVSIIAFVDEGADASPLLVLELVDGENLATFCRAFAPRLRSARETAGLLPDRVAVHVACAVLRALAAVQRAVPGLVHRDVTPHNVLVSREGEVKLADFGIALARERVRWTAPSRVKGKAGYMAPEQVRGEPLDERTDLFAVGILLYELLARVRPFGGPSARPMTELRAIDRGEMTPLLEVRPRIDVGLACVVERLLRASPRERPPSAEAALRALGPYGAGELGSLRLATISRALRGDACEVRSM